MIILNVFVVFSLTLLLTKSKIFAGKREFVELRYEAAKVDNQQPTWIHKWWHAIMTCPMCSGFWVAIPICFFYPTYDIFVDVLVVFGANWIVHCLENLLFFGGKLAEDISDINFEAIKKHNVLRLIEKNLKFFLDNHKK